MLPTHFLPVAGEWQGVGGDFFIHYGLVPYVLPTLSPLVQVIGREAEGIVQHMRASCYISYLHIA